MLSERASAAGVPVYEIRHWGDVDLLAAMRIWRIRARLKPDLLHLHTSHAHMLGVLATLGKRIPRIVSRRLALFPIRTVFSSIKYSFNVDRYIAISEPVRQALIDARISEAKIAVVHSGVDPARFANADGARIRREFGWDPSHLVVGNVAAISEMKGHLELFQAARTVLRQCDQARFLVVGEGELLERLRRDAINSGIVDRLILPGFRDDIPDIIAACDLFVMPSRHEGLGTSILDAMVLGKPVVASCTGGIPDIIRNEHNGLLVPIEDPDALAAAIMRMLADAELRHRCAENGRRTVEEHFVVDKMVDETIKVYREVLGRGSST